MKANYTAILLSIIVIGLWLLSGFATYHYIHNWNDRGAFGSMFQAIGALFSGLALIGVVYAILLQRQELQLQREEMEANREELRRSAQAQENSEDALNLTVKLSALSAMLSYYNLQSTSSASGIRQKYSEESAEKLVEEMEAILTGLNKPKSS